MIFMPFYFRLRAANHLRMSQLSRTNTFQILFTFMPFALRRVAFGTHTKEKKHYKHHKSHHRNII